MVPSSSPTLVSHSFSPENAKPQTKHRRSAYYEPSIWGDRFLHFSYDNMALDVFAKQIEELKEKVRPMLSVDGIKPTSNVLNLIDIIQRLGVAYHFKKEIDTALEHVFNDHAYYDDDDLSTTALHFRVLRQHGYNASCDVFGQYKDNDGKFKTSLINDVPGMLSLYEATHLRVPGEEIMDEALEFTSSHLMSMVNHSSLPFEKQVTYALRHPIYKNMPRLEARRYIGIYQQDDKHNEVLLQLAKLDFNLLQSLHLRELSDLSKWWKSLQFSSKLPFARDRLVECYFWILGVYFEPNFSLARNFLTKVIAMTSIIDDIYDSYGILDELLLFTDAIERWDISAIDLLPEYMKVCYYALLEVYNEIEDVVTKEGRLYCVEYAKEFMKDLVQAYLIEEKWHDKGYIPTTEEYMKNSLISSGYPLLTVVSFIGMGDIVPEEAFHWVKNDVIPVKASALICRLMDDIVSHEFEQKRGHVASAIECYMKEYNAREEDACKEFNIRIDQAWKDLNLGCLKPTVVPMTLLERVVNLSRMMDVMYKHDDGYNNVGSNLKEYISSLLVTSIPM